jgi:hypothetical protein
MTKLVAASAVYLIAIRSHSIALHGGESYLLWMCLVAAALWSMGPALLDTQWLLPVPGLASRAPRSESL